MRNVRLSELFEFQPKSKILAKEGKLKGKYAFYTSSPTLSKFIDNYQFQGEHLIFGTGGNASIHYSRNGFAVSTDCLVAKPKERELFNPKYVFYYIKNNIHVLEMGFRGAGLQHISKAYIENLIIPLPSFGTQNQIVSILDKATNIYEHSGELLEKIQELKESIYFSLFGIKASNYAAWDLVRLEKLANENKGSIRTGPFGSNLLHDEFLPEGDILVLGLENVASNYFKKIDKFITKSKYESLKNYRVYPRDLLIALMGTGTTGKSAVVPDKIQLAINTKHLAAISLNQKIANPYYVSSAIQFNPSVINQIELKNKGAVIPGINLTVVKGLKINVPPIKLQNKFEKIIRKIEDSLILKILLHRQQAELLIGAISQYAFQGNLKTNIEAFSLDERVVDYIENQELKSGNFKAVEQQFKEIKLILQNIFNNKVFTFSEMEIAIASSKIEIEYEYPIAEKRKGLRDFVFDAIAPNGANKPFLNQLFEVDNDRDAEKGIDNSRITFSLNV